MGIITYENYENSKIGTKAYNLFLMSKNGINVPKLFCVNDANSEEINSYIQNNFSNNTLFAIRSSSSFEDGTEKSFAGQFNTYLNIKKENVIEKINECRANFFSEGLESYIKEAKLNKEGLQINVIVQEMIEAQKSGVIFTSNPQGILNETVIVVGQGTGNNVVEDKVNTTTYYYNRNDDIYYYESQEDAVTLNSEELKEIIEVSKKIEKIFGEKLDIEFAIKDGNLYILQARKITTLDTKKEIVLDNSNIVESYPGISLPLTQSFVKEVYYQIVKNVLLRLTNDEKTVTLYDNNLQNMVATANGRIYYQISNWYDILKILPLSKKIIPMWQEMLGIENKQVQEESEFKVSSKVKFKVVKNFFKLLKENEKEMEELTSFFNSIQEYHKSKYKDNMTSLELVNLYEDLKQKIMQKWDLTLVNDMYAFIYTALVKKNIKDENISNLVIGNVNNLESMKPIEKLIEISIYAKNNNKYFELKNITSTEEYYAMKDTQLYKILTEYIEEYGDRNVEELKLESKTFRTDPLILVNKLVSYMEDENLESYLNKKEDFKEKNSLSNKVKKYLHKAEMGIRYREKSRLSRSKLYGIMRKIVLDIADNFVKENIIEDKNDIFYLYYNEILEVINNKKDVKKLVADRKVEYKMYEKLPAYTRLIFSNEIVNKKHVNINDEEFSASQGVIQGIPCSSGIVKGEVIVVNSSNIAQVDSKDKILVTKMTDPGWVYLITRAKGVIAEKGSLLSHTAIISRELKKPAVVGVKNITRILKTGDIVELDATNGKITKM